MQMDKGTPWSSLPHEVTDSIMFFLGSIDMCGYLPMVSHGHRDWISEIIFRNLCFKIYLTQTSKKQLVLERWGSWRNMLINRPRVRLNGQYCLQTLYSRAPCNDNFWEEKKYQSVEVYYFRHLRFFSNNRVLYAHNTVHPHDMIANMGQALIVPKKVFDGEYIIRGQFLFVRIIMHYCIMYFVLSIEDADDGWVGKHNSLRIIHHFSINGTIFDGTYGHYLGSTFDTLISRENSENDAEPRHIDRSIGVTGHTAAGASLPSPSSSSTSAALNRTSGRPRSTIPVSFWPAAESSARLARDIDDLRNSPVAVGFPLPTWETFLFWRRWDWE